MIDKFWGDIKEVDFIEVVTDGCIWARIKKNYNDLHISHTMINDALY